MSLYSIWFNIIFSTNMRVIGDFLPQTACPRYLQYVGDLSLLVVGFGRRVNDLVLLIPGGLGFVLKRVTYVFMCVSGLEPADHVHCSFG